MTEPTSLPKTCSLSLTLLSDTAPGRGEGIAGLLDAEIDHDEYGLPFFHGRRIKGLLSAQCAEILGALRLQNKLSDWANVADQVFGRSGLNTETSANVVFGPATLPAPLRTELSKANRFAFSREDVLMALTSVRRQTKIEESGAAKDKSLRASRVVRRGLVFTASIRFVGTPTRQSLGLLAACSASLRHVGTHRARGLGWVKAQLVVPGVSQPLAWFEQEVRS
jgi:hypothetical protein